MTLADSIVKYGTEAVLAYSKIAGIAQANEVPEVFLGSFIARRLHEEQGVNAHIERKYLKILVELGFKIDGDLIDLMGLHAADVALYDKARPIAIVEIKKYDERGGDSLIRRDLEKMHNLSSRVAAGSLQTFVAVLVTDTEKNGRYQKRVAELGRKLGSTFDVFGTPQICGEGDNSWSWQFVCGSFVNS